MSISESESMRAFFLAEGWPAMSYAVSAAEVVVASSILLLLPARAGGCNCVFASQDQDDLAP